MGAEEPDLYRDTWVRYLGELRHRGWHRERCSGAGTGNPVSTMAASTEYRRCQSSRYRRWLRMPVPGVGSATPRAPERSVPAFLSR